MAPMRSRKCKQPSKTNAGTSHTNGLGVCLALGARFPSHSNYHSSAVVRSLRIRQLIGVLRWIPSWTWTFPFYYSGEFARVRSASGRSERTDWGRCQRTVEHDFVCTSNTHTRLISYANGRSHKRQHILLAHVCANIVRMHAHCMSIDGRQSEHLYNMQDFIVAVRRQRHCKDASKMHLLGVGWCRRLGTCSVRRSVAELITETAIESMHVCVQCDC